MLASKTSKRLKRLTELGICSSGNTSEYVDELKRLADKTMSLELAEKKSKVFKALADENRLRILSLLAAREMCVCEVMVALDLTQPTASHHLRILENVGLVKDKKKGKWVFYRVSNQELVENVRKLNVK